jgi:hypothetical protein
MAYIDGFTVEVAITNGCNEQVISGGCDDERFDQVHSAVIGG